MTVLRAFVVTAPTVEPVSLSDLKDHLRVTDNDQDEYLDNLIVEARRAAEIYTDRAFINTTYGGWLDGVPAEDFIQVTPGPVASISAIKYYATDDTEATWASTNYSLDTGSLPARVYRKYGCNWPTGATRTFNALYIEWVAGYGSVKSSVPQNVCKAIMLIAGHWFIHRVPVVLAEIPHEHKSMLFPYRILPW